MADGGKGMLYFPLFNYSAGDLELLHALHQHPRTVLGLSDAGAHCGAICDGGMPTFMLRHWARDRSRGPRLPLERRPQPHRHRPARAPPPGAGTRPPRGRLAQRARGYVATLCASELTMEHDEPTGALPGRLLRGPKPARRA